MAPEKKRANELERRRREKKQPKNKREKEWKTLRQRKRACRCMTCVQRFASEFVRFFVDDQNKDNIYTNIRIKSTCNYNVVCIHICVRGMCL